jgi:hypothetical protein
MRPALFTFKVFHPKRAAEDLERALALAATHRHTAGARRSTPTGRLLDGTYDQTYCSFNFLGTGVLEADIGRLALLLAPKHELLNSIVSEGGVLRCSVGVNRSHLPLTFSVEMLRELSSLGIIVDVTIYDVAQERGHSVENVL